MFKHKDVDAKIFATRDHQAPRPLVRQNYFWIVPLAIQLGSRCLTPKYFAIKDHQISPLSWGIISFEKSLIRKNPSGADFQGRPFWSTHISSAFCKMILHFLFGDIVCTFSRHALAQTSGVGGQSVGRYMRGVGYSLHDNMQRLQQELVWWGPLSSLLPCRNTLQSVLVFI